MSLLAIDVGTTGCKSVVFSAEGDVLASAYREYDIQHREPGWAELDPVEVWARVEGTIREVAARVDDPIRAAAVSSLGEATVPVTAEREILGPSILLIDARGAEYVPDLRAALAEERLYAINGNTWGNQYGLTKLMWARDRRPERYERAHKFLPWGSFISFMLGAEAKVDYTLANRLLLFDLARGAWSDELLSVAGLDREKLPEPVPSGTVIGRVDPAVADDLGLPRNVAIVAGAHDQCANALGCGVIRAGQAAYGMGTFTCITAAFAQQRDAAGMIERGLNTEHHAAPGRFVSFIFNQGGGVVKWYRDTFAVEAKAQAKMEGRDVYFDLFSELSPDPSRLMVLPHFSTTGTPDFFSDVSGVIAGLRLDTERAHVLKAIVEGVTFDLKESVVSLPGVGIEIDEYRAAGGGSKSDAWVQTSADILGRPFVRPAIVEATAVGDAVMAGVGVGEFASFEEGVDAIVKLERTFEPDPKRVKAYEERFGLYRRLWPLMKDYIRELEAWERE